MYQLVTLCVPAGDLVCTCTYQLVTLCVPVSDLVYMPICDCVYQELQYKNATLKSELAETRTKKNAEINTLEEQLG